MKVIYRVIKLQKSPFVTLYIFLSNGNYKTSGLSIRPQNHGNGGDKVIDF